MHCHHRHDSASDKEDYDILPVRVVTIVEDMEGEISHHNTPSFLKIDRDEVSIVDLSANESDYPYLDPDTTGYL